MNPYPTRAELRREATGDALLAAQASATDAFRAIVATASAAIALLDFPLGCPAAGYDMDDVTGILADWLAPSDARRLRDLAADAYAFAEAA
jgi:hypothetical protein